MPTDSEIRAQLLLDIAAVFGKEYSVGAMRLILEMLQPVPIEALKKAIVELSRSSKFMPTPSEIIEHWKNTANPIDPPKFPKCDWTDEEYHQFLEDHE